MQRPVLQSREVLNGYVYFASDIEGRLAGVRFNRGDTDSQHTITFVRKHGDWEAPSCARMRLSLRWAYATQTV